MPLQPGCYVTCYCTVQLQAVSPDASHLGLWHLLGGEDGSKPSQSPLSTTRLIGAKKDPSTLLVAKLASRLAPSLRWEQLDRRGATSHMGMKGQEDFLDQCKLCRRRDSLPAGTQLEVAGCLVAQQLLTSLQNTVMRDSPGSAACTLLAAVMASRFAPSFRWQAAWLSSALFSTSRADALISSLSFAKFCACSARSVADCRVWESGFRVPKFLFDFLRLCASLRLLCQVCRQLQGVRC